MLKLLAVGMHGSPCEPFTLITEDSDLNEYKAIGQTQDGRIVQRLIFDNGTIIDAIDAWHCLDLHAMQ